MILPDPRTTDLQPWARRAFEEAYRCRPREQASREDMAYGFLCALVWARVASAFRGDRHVPGPSAAAPPVDEPQQQGQSHAGSGVAERLYRPGALPGKRRVRYDGR